MRKLWNWLWVIIISLGVGFLPHLIEELMRLAGVDSDIATVVSFGLLILALVFVAALAFVVFLIEPKIKRRRVQKYLKAQQRRNEELARGAEVIFEYQQKQDRAEKK